MHGNSGQYKDAYLQLTDVIKDTPHLFTNTSTYTLPTSSLASVQSYSRQLTHLIHGACGAETVMNWHLSEADRLASELAKHCSVNHSASRPTATAFPQQWNDDALEPPALHCEQLGRDVETLAIQFAEISDKDLAIPAHAWHNAGTALQRFAINIHHAGAAITQATGVSMHRWVVSIESFSQQVINVAKRIDYFTRVYSASHTALNDIMKHRREALENPAFRTYSFPEAPFTARADHILTNRYNPGLLRADTAGLSFPQPGNMPQSQYTPYTPPVEHNPTYGTSRRSTVDFHHPVYDPGVREAYKKLFTEQRTPDPLATDGRNQAYHRPDSNDPPIVHHKDPQKNRILPTPGLIRGPIRHPDDPLYGTGR